MTTEYENEQGQDQDCLPSIEHHYQELPGTRMFNPWSAKQRPGFVWFLFFSEVFA